MPEQPATRRFDRSRICEGMGKPIKNMSAYFYTGDCSVCGKFVGSMAMKVGFAALHYKARRKRNRDA